MLGVAPATPALLASLAPRLARNLTQSRSEQTDPVPVRRHRYGGMAIDVGVTFRNPAPDADCTWAIPTRSRASTLRAPLLALDSRTRRVRPPRARRGGCAVRRRRAVEGRHAEDDGASRARRRRRAAVRAAVLEGREDPRLPDREHLRISRGATRARAQGPGEASLRARAATHARRPRRRGPRHPSPDRRRAVLRGSETRGEETRGRLSA